jgi:5'-nucleotidase/UDP-sugar diphosphatase
MRSRPLAPLVAPVAPVALLAFVALFACAAPAPTPAPTPAPPASTSTSATTSAPPHASPHAPPHVGAKGTHELHLLFSSDEHGWLVPLNDKDAKVQRGGVTTFFDRITRVEGYAATQAARDQGWLLLSAGDMWTGPYESTVLEGAPMVAAMSHMGYAASAVGNHEFDFGVRVLSERAKTSRFPFLAANLIETAKNAAPSWAKPWTIVDAGGVRVGVVGLTNEDSPVTADPRHMTGLKFLPYAPALERALPEVRKAGAEEVIVLMHAGTAHAPELLPIFRKHKVRAVAFGHHHTQALAIDEGGTPDQLDDDVVLCNAGPYLRSYCRIDLTLVDGKLSKREARIGQVEQAHGTPFAADVELQRIVSAAEQSANLIGGEVLVENNKTLKRGVDGAMGQLIVDAWLQALPYAHAAITNAGGIRQDLAAGPVRMRDIVSVLPFNNYLLVVDLTGAQLKEVLSSHESVAGGVRFTFKEAADHRVLGDVTDAKGGAIKDDARFKVVINDFMYRGGDRYRFQAYDPEPEETAIDWREPLLRKLREMGKANQKLDVEPDDRARKR